MEPDELGHLLGPLAGEAEAAEEGAGVPPAEQAGEAELEVRGQGGHDGRGVRGQRAREERGLEAGLPELGQGAADGRPQQQPFQLRADALARHLPERDGRERRDQGGVEGEIQRGDEAQRAQGPKGILGEACGGRAHGAEPAGPEVREAAFGVDPAGRIEGQGHGVHGEVAPREIRGEVGPPVAGHVDRAGGARNHHGPEAEADRDRPGEEREDLLGVRGAGDVPVCHRAAEAQIAQAPPDEDGLVAGRREGRQHPAHRLGNRRIRRGARPGHGAECRRRRRGPLAQAPPGR